MITPYSNIISVTTLEAPLLDTYSGAAAAYSLRLLRSAYTGDAIRVRRASDNTELDIGFVDNELDTSALTTFCSGTDGFVETWYDQSGNGYDATQSTSANQPQIVSSGSVILDGGKPCVYFDGSGPYMDISSSLLVTNPTLFFVVTPKGNSISQSRNGGIMYLSNGTSTNHFGGGAISSDWYDSFFSTTRPRISSSPIFTNNRYSGYLHQNGTQIIAYLNANLWGSPSATIVTNVTNPKIGAQSGSAYPSNNNYQELILYPSDQSSNRTGIETNINDFYSIY